MLLAARPLNVVEETEPSTCCTLPLGGVNTGLPLSTPVTVHGGTDPVLEIEM